jgi:hypothetical protein
MSYFDQINGFIDNVGQTQNAIDSFKQAGFNQSISDLEDKYSLIRQKALEAVPDEAGDILNYATQGVTALSGTYNTIRALKKSKLGQAVTKKITGKDSAQVETPSESSDPIGSLLDKAKSLKTNIQESADEAVNKVTDAVSGKASAYEDVAQSAQQGFIDPKVNIEDVPSVPRTADIASSAEDFVAPKVKAGASVFEALNSSVTKALPPEPTSAFEALAKARAEAGEAPESITQALPKGKAPAVEDLTPTEEPLSRNILSASETASKAPAKPKLDVDAVNEIDPISGMTPDVAKAYETSADPEKFLRDFQSGDLDRAVSGVAPPAPQAPSTADLPFEQILPKATPPEASITERMANLAEQSQRGGQAGGSSLLADIQANIKAKANVEPESSGANAVEDAGGLSRAGAVASIAELGAGGVAAGLEDIQGTSTAAKAGRTTGQVINDGIAVKGGYNLGKRAQRGLQRLKNGNGDNEADAASENPAKPQNPPSQEPDYAPLEDEPLDVDARIAQIRQKAQEAQDALPTEDDPSLTPRLQALEQQQQAPEPKADPEPESGDIKPPAQPEPDIDPVSGVTDDAVKEATSNIVEDTAKQGGKTLGQTILDTMGADSATELALDSVGVVGEVAGLGLMLGGILHDVFGRKKIEREQEAQEQQAQQQEQTAEQGLKVAQAQQTDTTAGIDLSSLHNIAGANASVGIV